MLTDIRVKVGQEVKPEEIIGMHRGHLTHHLDAVRKYHFSSDVERAELLLEIIKQWAGKPITLFCNGGGALRYFDWNEWTSNSQADETPLGWKDPSNCNSCGITQEVLRAIFGQQEMPFIEFHGYRCYALNLRKLILFTGGGQSALEAEERKKREAEIKKAQARIEQSVMEALKDATVSDANRTAMIQYRAQDGHWNTVKVVSPDLVVCNADRHEHGGSGGIGMFCQARVWYKGQTQMKEWQWRDRYSPNRDNPSMVIHGIGKVSQSVSSAGKVEIKVELVNTQHGNRSTAFTFEDKDATTAPVLSNRDQVAFTSSFEKERNRVLAQLMKLWPLKPKMLTSKGQSNYGQPAIKQQVEDASIGIGAFVTEEQIDHRHENRQVRFELRMMKFGDKESQLVLEDHGYEETEGSRVISIIELTPKAVVVNTHSGKKTIELS
jgi:hypothetical protein